jgi:hypothetical protein
VLGYFLLAQPEAFADHIDRTQQLKRSYDSASTSVAHLLALRALMTGSAEDAQAARDAVDEISGRGAGWISTEVFLEELGHPLPPVPTQWTIPYDQVRRNWLNIADGIIERAKAQA